MKKQQPIIIVDAGHSAATDEQEVRQLKDKLDRQVAQSNLQDQMRNDRHEETLNVLRKKWNSR